MILFAAVNKIKVSPVKAMICQWLGNFRMTGPISCTSMISCIASMLENLEEYNIPFLGEERTTIDDSYLIQGHILKKGSNDSYIFFYPGYTNEFLLPNLELHLYSCESLVFPLTPQVEARRSTMSLLPGRLTRSRTRRAIEQQQPQPQVTPPIQTGWSPNMIPDPVWEQAVYLRSMGPSSWQTGSSGAWAQHPQHSSTPETARVSSSLGGPPPTQGHRRSTSTCDINYISKQLGELTVRTGAIEESLNTHIQSSIAWRQQMEEDQRRRDEEFRAYMRWTGYNPHQQQ
jgi:hypothetical protein